MVIDGTDEFDPSFQLIKGGGAASFEKIVAQASTRMVWWRTTENKLAHGCLSH